MRTPFRTVLAPGALAIAIWPGVAWPQATTPTAPVTPPTPAPVPAGSEGGIGLTIGLLVGFLVLIVVAVRLFDLRRRRESEAVHLQARISDALLREPGLFGLPVTPTAHVAFWRGSPARIELTGRVPDAATRDTILRLAREEAQRVRPDAEIEDRLVIDEGAALPRVA